MHVRKRFVLALVLPILAGPSTAQGHGGAPGAVDRAAHRYFGHAALGAKALRVAKCESGYKPTARSRNGIYFGLMQFDIPTWRGNGGRGHPRWATPNEQMRVSYVTWKRRGWQPWPLCGKR